MKNQNQLRDNSYIKIKHSIDKMKDPNQKQGIENFIELYEQKTKRIGWKTDWVDELRAMLNEKIKSLDLTIVK